MRSCCRTFILSFMTQPFMKSMAIVELDARTRDDSVDMDAASTRMTASAISDGLRFSSIVGTIESYPFAAMSILSANTRPKPPRK